MTSVWLNGFAVAHPENWISQEEAARRIGLVSGEPRRVSAIARGTQILGRSIALSPDEIAALGTIEERNRIYQQVAPAIATQAALSALGDQDPHAVAFLATSSCTGYMVPGLDVAVAQSLGLHAQVARLPITEAGCAGGIVAIARVADYLRAHPGSSGLAVAAEVCSLAFHPKSEEGNLTSALIFGDGAGAALVQSTRGEGTALEVIDCASHLIPDSQEALGFNLTDGGFYPVLSRDLSDLLLAPTVNAVGQLLTQNGLGAEDVAFWLMHPGGPRILEALGHALDLSETELRWSWDAMRDFGNTSSAAIFDVLRRNAEEDAAPRGLGVVIAFGPGVSIEMMLVRRC